MKNALIAFLFAVTACFSACSDDDDVMPSYQQNLVELQTDFQGNIVRMLTDDGRVLKVTHRIKKLVPDTIYRVLALYEENETGVVLSSAQQVFSPKPIAVDPACVTIDPVELKAVWKSPRYINLLLGVKTGGMKQAFDFVTPDLRPTGDGSKKISITLYHNQLDDPLYYTQNYYFSCPIYPFEGQLVEGRDSVEILVNTFEKLERRSFAY